jgi:hypothetical protein
MGCPSGQCWPSTGFSLSKKNNSDDRISPGFTPTLTRLSQPHLNIIIGSASNSVSKSRQEFVGFCKIDMAGRRTMAYV